jgi:hypothetical protein
MYSVSPGTPGNRRSRQSAIAWSMRSDELETKFQWMCRFSGSGSPPSNINRAGSLALRMISAPGLKTTSWAAVKSPTWPATSTAPETM